MYGPQLSKGQIALLVNMGNNEAARVHVGGKHHLWTAPLLVDNKVSHGVDGVFIHVRSRQCADSLRDLALVPRRSVTGIEGLEQC